MTWYDRLLVAAASRLMARICRRFSTADQRVWWANITTIHPRALLWAGGAPEIWPADLDAGELRVAFGTPKKPGTMTPPEPFLVMTFTREMLDVFIDGAAEVRNRQDVQLKAMGGKP